MKKVIGKKLFCLALVLAMVIGTIGVQKVKVSAADEENFLQRTYSHVEIKNMIGAPINFSVTKNHTETDVISGKLKEIKSVVVKYSDEEKCEEWDYAYQDNNNPKVKTSLYTDNQAKLVPINEFDGNSTGKQHELSYAISDAVVYRTSDGKGEAYYSPSDSAVGKSWNGDYSNTISDWDAWLKNCGNEFCYAAQVRFPVCFESIEITVVLDVNGEDKTIVKKYNPSEDNGDHKINQSQTDDCRTWGVDVALKDLKNDATEEFFSYIVKPSKSSEDCQEFTVSKSTKVVQDEFIDKIVELPDFLGWQVYTRKYYPTSEGDYSNFSDNIPTDFITDIYEYSIDEYTKFVAVFVDDSASEANCNIDDIYGIEEISNRKEDTFSHIDIDLDEKFASKKEFYNDYVLYSTTEDTTESQLIGISHVYVVYGVGDDARKLELQPANFDDGKKYHIEAHDDEHPDVPAEGKNQYGYVVNSEGVGFHVYAENGNGYYIPHGESDISAWRDDKFMKLRFPNGYDHIEVVGTILRGNEVSGPYTFTVANTVNECDGGTWEYKGVDFGGMNISERKDYFTYNFYKSIDGQEEALRGSSGAECNCTVYTDLVDIQEINDIESWDVYEKKSINDQYELITTISKGAIYTIKAPTKFVAKYAHEDATVHIVHHYNYVDAAGSTKAYDNTIILKGNVANNWKDGNRDIYVGATFEALESDKNPIYEGVTYNFVRQESNKFEIGPDDTYNKVQFFYSYTEPSNGGNGGSNYVFIPTDDGPKDDPKDNVKEEVKEEPVVEEVVDVVVDETPEADVEEEPEEEVIVEEPAPEEEEEVDVVEDIAPQGLPKTGTLPVPAFFGFGAFCMACGAAVLVFRRRK